MIVVIPKSLKKHSQTQMSWLFSTVGRPELNKFLKESNLAGQNEVQPGPLPHLELRSDRRDRALRAGAAAVSFGEASSQLSKGENFPRYPGISPDILARFFQAVEAVRFISS